MNGGIQHKIKQKLEQSYQRYNKKKFIHPDPLEFLFNYRDNKDKEVVALIASSLAYGKVNQILRSVSTVLNILSKNPYSKLFKTNKTELIKKVKVFKHRFTNDTEIINFLL